MSSNSFPDLVMEKILSYFSINECLSTRLISSEWDLVVMSRYRKHPERVILRGNTDFHNFVNVFTDAKYGNPFKKYILSPSEGTDEEFVAFAKFAGPQIAELTADVFKTRTGVTWGNWARSGRGGTSEYGVPFFRRLTRLLQFTSNLEYLGIMFLGSDFENPGSPINGDALPHLSKLRIFARVPAERYTGWCEALIRQSSFLQGARQIKADMFRLEDQNFSNPSNIEPAIVNGYPLKNYVSFMIHNQETLTRIESTLREETKYLMYARVNYYPTGDKTRILHFPSQSLPTISDFYYSEHSSGYYSLVFQSGQFSSLRRLIIDVNSNLAGEYPFQNCLIPTVEKLTLAISMKDCKNWNLAKNFPNVQNLIIYAKSRFAEYQLRDLLEPFEGREILKSLIVEDTNSETSLERLIPSWEEVFGLGKNHACYLQTRVGFSRLMQSRCEIIDCPGGKGLAFPRVQKLEFVGIELDNVLPLLIRSIRCGSFPEVENLFVSGHTTKNYSTTDVPNVEDCKSMLSALVKDFQLKVK